jgi:hypothetical protein
LLCLFAFFGSSANAQETPLNEVKGKVSGTVTDKTSGQPIEGASISLYNVKDSTSKTGANTDAQGKFLIENVPAGQYYLEANMVGYSTAVVRGINITSSAADVKLQPITLKPGETMTDEIVIEEEKSDVQFTAEKKIFNVGKDLTTTGGSLVDVLRNVPAVEVDQDGNISMRGSGNVKILVDGKPFGLDGANRTNILKSISAENVESVELITNPSAKYEAEGVSGIINIVLKKNDAFGYNGTLNLNAGTEDKYNGDLNLNIRNSTVNLFADYSYRLFNFDMESSTSREVFFNPSAPLENTNSNSQRRIKSHFARGGVDYTIDALNSLTLSGSYSKREFTGGTTLFERSYNSSGSLISDVMTGVNNDNSGYSYDFALNYYRKFKNPRQSLTGEFNFTNYVDDQNPLTDITDLPDGSLSRHNQVQHSDTKEANIKADYVHPTGEQSKIEAGYQSELVDDKNDYQYTNYDFNTNTYINDTNRSNNFNFKRQVHGVYLQYSGGFDNFTYQAGLRGEYTNMNGELVTTGETFDGNYFDLFPSASLSQKLGKEEEMQLSYSRRINRPHASQLNPFPQSFSASSRDLFSGNPNLKPEYINSFELSFIKYFSTTTITPSLFYRHSDDAISKSRIYIDSVTTLTRDENYSTQDAYGGELILSTKPLPWLNINGSLSYTNTKVKANISGGIENESSSLSGRVSTSFRFPGIFNLQLFYFNSGKYVAAQGIVSPFHSLDGAITKDFLEGSATIGLRVSDIFKTLKFEIDIKDPNYAEKISFARNNRVATLTFTYRFGVADKNQRRRNRPQQNDGDGGFGF